jgi:hypothetical protein
VYDVVCLKALDFSEEHVASVFKVEEGARYQLERR